MSLHLEEGGYSGTLISSHKELLTVKLSPLNWACKQTGSQCSSKSSNQIAKLLRPHGLLHGANCSFKVASHIACYSLDIAIV